MMLHFSLNRNWEIMQNSPSKDANMWHYFHKNLPPNTKYHQLMNQWQSPLVACCLIAVIL
jgi:hypothetical protein